MARWIVVAMILADTKSAEECGLPDPAICRVRKITAEIFECLAEDPKQCRCAMPFGFGHFCRHPQRKCFGTPGDFERRQNPVLQELQAAS
jgi:hypothetical protein